PAPAAEAQVERPAPAEAEKPAAAEAEKPAQAETEKPAAAEAEAPAAGPVGEPADAEEMKVAVKKGDTLSEIARQNLPPGVNLNQMRADRVHARRRQSPDRAQRLARTITPT